MEKVRTAHRLPDPDPDPEALYLIAGRPAPHVARYNGNGVFLVTGFLPGVPRPADRVDWWARLPPEFTEGCGEPEAAVERRVDGWGPAETVRNG